MRAGKAWLSGLRIFVENPRVEQKFEASESFKEIKKDLSKIKKNSYEFTNKYHYNEHEAKEQIIKLKMINDKLSEEINKLNDTNRTLYMNYCNYTFE